MPAVAAPLWLPSPACGRLCRRRGRQPPQQPGGEATRRRRGEAPRSGCQRRLGVVQQRPPRTVRTRGSSGGRAGARLGPSSSASAAAASYSFYSFSGQSLWKKGSGRGAEGSWPAPRRPPGQRVLKRKNGHLSSGSHLPPSLLAKSTGRPLEEGALPTHRMPEREMVLPTSLPQAPRSLPQILELQSGDCFWEAPSLNLQTLLKNRSLLAQSWSPGCYTN